MVRQVNGKGKEGGIGEQVNKHGNTVIFALGS